MLKPPIVHGSITESSDPLAGFDQCEGMMSKIYLLQVKTGSSSLDDALYALAHMGAVNYYPYGSEQVARREVVASLRAMQYGSHGTIATELADAYEEQYCSG